MGSVSVRVTSARLLTKPEENNRGADFIFHLLDTQTQITHVKENLSHLLHDINSMSASVKDT